jgi:hypothetical protein
MNALSLHDKKLTVVRAKSLEKGDVFVKLGCFYKVVHKDEHFIVYNNAAAWKGLVFSNSSFYSMGAKTNEFVYLVIF